MPSSNDLHNAKRLVWDQCTSQSREAMKNFASMKVEAIKDALCGCPVEKVQSLQGEAAAYREMIDALTNEPYDID